MTRGFGGFNVTILIVEDDDEMRRMIRSVVGRLADHVSECRDGAEAVAAYKDRPTDWVLMDIQLPGMDGIEVTRRIVASHPAARIVMVTNYEDRQLRQAAREAGASDYVSKSNLLRLLDVLK